MSSLPDKEKSSTSSSRKDEFDEQAKEFASNLFSYKGKNRENVTKHLSQNGDFYSLVATKYMELFDFSDMKLDEALRTLLRKFILLGETQERERVLHYFVVRYSNCNPHFLHADIDALHILVCAVALLNTDLHGAKYGGHKKMTQKQFISNLSGILKGHEIPTSILKDIYRSISKQPLPMSEDVNSSKKSSAAETKSPPVNKTNVKKKPALRSQSMNQPNSYKIRQLPIFHYEDGKRVGPSRGSKVKTLPRKQGVLWRKPVFESEGNKTAKRKRHWKLVVAALHGLELHLAKKDSQDARKISLHHCLAEVEQPNSTTRRINVFRLTLADMSVALYQTNSKEELRSWVHAINRNAALLSAAPLPAGVGSQLKFQRPLMPSACSTLPLAKQLEEQQNQLERLCTEMDEHRLHLPQDGASAAVKQFHKDKDNYLRHEVHKYEVFTSTLCELLSTQPRSDETSTDTSKSDRQSLLSVSPSEPGTTLPSPHGWSADVDLDGKASRVNPLVSSLSPTTSLPNLQPPFDSPLKDRLLQPSTSRDLSQSSNQNNSNSRDVTPRQGKIVVASNLDPLRNPVTMREVRSRLFPSPRLRVRGRKERQGTSRHSYVHALQAATQLQGS